MTLGRAVKILSMAAVVAALVAAAGIGIWAWRSLHQPYRGYAQSAVEVEIAAGLDAGSILDLLAGKGVIADALLARLYLVHFLGDPALKAGEYRFEGPLTTPEVLAKLARGEVVTHSVTVIEGLTADETAQHLAGAGFGSLPELQEILASPELISDLDRQASDLEGYLFPDTYAFARGTAAKEIVETMVATFRRRFASEVRPLLEAPAAARLRDLVILASIVEAEATLDEERPIIAGVYTNRLERGIALYADPTVIFALKRLGRWNGNLRRPDLEIDDPYNTYRYPGLPPGPICSPGLASLEAAASPAEVPYLYFVSRNDGSHAFATTLAEHNRNVYRWQKLYWRERWAKERAQKSSTAPPSD